MAEMDALAREIAKLLTKILHDDIDPSKPNARLAEDYGANSMDVVDVVETLEGKFGIEIPNNDISKFVTFGDVLSYVSERLPSS